MSKPSTEVSSPVNQGGQIEDQDLAHDMADAEWVSREDNKGKEKSFVEQEATKASNETFREQTNQEYAGAVREAQEGANNTIDIEVKTVEGDIQGGTARVEQTQGATAEDKTHAIHAGNEFSSAVEGSAVNSKQGIQQIMNNEAQGVHNDVNVSETTPSEKPLPYRETKDGRDYGAAKKVVRAALGKDVFDREDTPYPYEPKEGEEIPQQQWTHLSREEFLKGKVKARDAGGETTQQKLGQQKTEFQVRLEAFDTQLDHLVNERKKVKDKNEKQKLTLEIKQAAKEKDDFVLSQKKPARSSGKTQKKEAVTPEPAVDSAVKDQSTILENKQENDSPLDSGPEPTTIEQPQPVDQKPWVGLSREEFLKEKLKAHEESKGQNEKEDALPSNRESIHKKEVELPFKQLDFVKVQRTSGAIEDDWWVGFIDDQEGKVKVFKEEKIDGQKRGKLIYKWVPTEELISLNPVKEESTIQEEQKTQESKEEKQPEVIQENAKQEQGENWEVLLKRSEERLAELWQQLGAAKQSGDETLKMTVNKNIAEELQIAKNIKNILNEGREKQSAVDSDTKTPTNAEAKPEKPKSEVKLAPEEAKRIENELKEFDLTPEDASKIDGFKDLSYGQKRMAIENLKQLTLKDIRVGSVKDQREDLAQTKGFWKKVWKGITKRYTIAKAEKTRSRGISKEESMQALEQLGRGMKNFDVGVEEKNGRLELQYVSGLEGLTEEQQAQVDRFNEVATELSRTPMEWTAPDAGKKDIFRRLREGLHLGSAWSPDDPRNKDRQRAESLDMEFGSLRGNVLALLEKKYRKEELKDPKEYSDVAAQSNAIAQMMRAENLMRTNRLLNTNPKAEKALESIKNGSVLSKALGNIATERGIYFAAGLAARSVGVALLGSAGLIAGAAGVGGWMGWRRAKETFRENEALAQHKSFEQAKQERVKHLARVGKEGKEVAQKSEKKTMMRVEDASVLTRNLDHFVEYINREENSERRHDLARRLADRVKYVQQVMSEGRMNFGENASVRANSLYELTDKLNLAINCAEMNNPTTKHKEKGISDIQQKLEQYLGEQKGLVDANKRKELVKKAAIGAGFGAAFTTAGMAATEVASTAFRHIDPHLFNRQGEVDIGVRWISDTKGGGGSGGAVLPVEVGGKGGIPPIEGGISGAGADHPMMGAVEGTHLGASEATSPIPDQLKDVLVAASAGEKAGIQKILNEAAETLKAHPNLKGNPEELSRFLDVLKYDLQANGIRNEHLVREVQQSVINKVWMAESGSLGAIDATHASPAEGTNLPPAEGSHLQPAEGSARTDVHTGRDPFQPAKEFLDAKTVAETKLSSYDLAIGKRGPEGALIDHLRTHPDVAKSFGWDGKANLSEWAGTKAHQLWLEDAKEALAKPETIAELKKLGYSADAKGYADMMHRIGKGFVEMDPQTHKINLVDMDYLKARMHHVEAADYQKDASGDLANQLAKEQFDAEHSLNPKGYMVDTPQDVEAHQAAVAEQQNPLNKYMVDTPQDVDAHQAQNSEDGIAKIINDYEAAQAKRPPENILAQNKATETATDASEQSNLDSETAQIPHGESFNKITHDDLHIEYKFGYDQSGNPTSLEMLKNEPFGVRGSEYFMNDYLRKIVDKLHDIKRPTLEKTYREDVFRDGRELIGYVKLYQELEYQGETKEAEFLHQHIMDEMKNMMKKYGPIIDRDKLPEAFRGK